jgi:hypothetical protein
MAGASTVRTTEGPWETQRPFLGTGFGRAEQLYQAGPAPYFPGETVAGFDPAQQQAQARTLGYLGGPRPNLMQAQAEQQLGRTYDWAQQIPQLGVEGARAVGPIPTTQMMTGEVPTGAGTPYGDLSDAYQQAVIGRLTDPTSGVLPQIRGSLVNYQPGGSPRGNMLQQSAISNAVTQGMSMPMAQMYGNAYQQAQSQRLPAAQQALGAYQQAMGGLQQGAQTGLAGVSAYPTIMGAPLAMYQAGGDVGQQRRALAQEAINQQMAKYNYAAQAPQIALQNYMAGISGEYGGTTQQTPSALGTAGQIGSVLTGLFGMG